MSDWTPEIKDQLIADYQSRNPTPETSLEIVKELADELGKTVNGVRIILSKANVYVKKATGTAATTSTGETKAPRVSKADAQKALTDIIASQGIEADDAIISKMTGKAAQYFTTLFTTIIGKDDAEDEDS